MSLTQKAIEADARCELAYLHLAQMYTQQGRLTEAVITYKRAIDLSRTTVDAESAIMGLEVRILRGSVCVCVCVCSFIFLFHDARPHAHK